MRSPSSKPLSSSPWRIYLFLGCLIGIVTAVIILTAWSGHQRAVHHTYLVKAAMQASLEATTAHLWFEEAINGDPYESYDSVMQHLQRSLWFTRAMLEGGEYKGKRIVPLRDPKLRRELREMIQKQKDFKSILKQRWAMRDTQATGIGSEIDQIFDAKFLSLVRQSNSVQNSLHQMLDEDLRQFKNMHFLTLVVVLVVFLLMIISLRNYIQQRNRAQIQAQEQKEDLAITLNSIGDAVIKTDIQGRVVWLNPVAEHLTQWSSEEATGRDMDEVFVISNALTGNKLTSPVHKVLQEGNIVGLANHTKLLAKDGTEYQIADSAAPIQDESGNTHGVVLVFRDVSQEYAQQERLRQSETALRNLFENAPIGIFRTNSQGKVLHLNPAMAKMLRCESQEQALATYQDLGRQLYLSPERRQQFIRLLNTYGQVEHFEYQGQRMDGTVAWFSMNARVSERPPDQPFIIDGFTSEITARKQAQEEKDKAEAQLRQAQKMEAVGRMAGGVAHDFNNMLGVIQGYADVALSKIEGRDSLYHHLLQIKHAAERSADLTRQLLAFSRKQIIQPKILDLNQVVENQHAMLSRLIGEDIDLKFIPGQDIWSIEMDPSQIDQVLANLVINARDAIDDQGTISIETANTTLDQTYTDTHLYVAPGDYVCLMVSDTGRGMDAQTREQIFDPFFTTKQEEKGTGLGMSTVYGIVKQNQGIIHVYSEPGQGTTFKLYFPKSEKPATEMETDQSDVHMQGQETVLLVEDEDLLLELTQTVLEEYGYTVYPARTPGEARQIAEKNKNRFHLLLTDVVMPEMNGKELKAAIESISPGIKTLFMSGYTDNIIVRRGMVDPDYSFIQKPFSSNTLAQKVREVLDSE